MLVDDIGVIAAEGLSDEFSLFRGEMVWGNPAYPQEGGYRFCGGLGWCDGEGCAGHIGTQLSEPFSEFHVHVNLGSDAITQMLDLDARYVPLD